MMAYILAITAIICERVRVDLSGITERSTRESGKQEGSMDLGFGEVTTEIAMRDSGQMAGKRDWEQENIKITYTKVNSSIVLNMAKEKNISKTETITEAHTSTANRMDLADTTGGMAATTRGSLQMDIEREKGSCMKRMVLFTKVIRLVS